MRMNRIVWHHTGGGLSPSDFDRRFYHRLVDGSANVHVGQHSIEANAPGRALRSGTYAAHTARLNTGAIGVALCAMANASWADPFASRAFPRPEQVEAGVQLTARLCVDYGIEVKRETVLSHAEVPITLGVPQAGKWDFDYSPDGDEGLGRDPVAIGDVLRRRIRLAIIDQQRGMPCPPPDIRPTIRRGASGPLVRDAQAALNRHGARLVVDGGFGPRTFDAVVAFQRARELRPDGVIGNQTWAALLAC